MGTGIPTRLSKQRPTYIMFGNEGKMRIKWDGKHNEWAYEFYVARVGSYEISLSGSFKDEKNLDDMVSKLQDLMIVED